MFQLGDLIMYGGTGVCRVEKIGSPGFSGMSESDLFYFLQPLYQEGTIYVPVGSDKVYMRAVLSRDEANELIDSMPGIQSEVYRPSSVQQLSKYYQSVINSHEVTDLIKLTKSIHKKKEEAARQNRHLGQIDKRYMKRAEDLLYGELAAALDIPRDDVESYIAERIDGSSDK